MTGLIIGASVLLALTLALLLRPVLRVPAEPSSRAPRQTATALAVALPLAALSLYGLIGSPASVTGGTAQRGTRADVENMVASLAAKLDKDPSNLKGWAMLGRSYKVMGRFADAEQAFDRAGPFIDGDAQLLADYADVAVSNAGGSFDGKPRLIIARALKADPENAMALWLAGTAALAANDHQGAIATWRHLLTLLPAGSEDAGMVQNAIEDARARAGRR
jgi:cytochrome c-type biogenesis protein CcmH